MNIRAIGANDKNLIVTVETLAQKIWFEHYASIISSHQTGYMLDKFQSKEAIIDQIANQGYLYYLLEDDNGDPAGYFAIVPQGKKLFLSKLYVTKENRNKKYGHRAIEFIEGAARQRSLSSIILRTHKNNTNSLKAYEKFGFTITRSVVTDIGDGFVMDDYELEKSVSVSG